MLTSAALWSFGPSCVEKSNLTSGPAFTLYDLGYGPSLWALFYPYGQ
jgi:hypothetical protein